MSDDAPALVLTCSRETARRPSGRVRRAVSPVTSYVVQTFITLVGVAVLAAVVLFAARRAGIGRPTGPIELVGRLPLEGRRSVYLVRVGSTVHMVGSSEAGLVKLGEVPESALVDSASPSDERRK